MAAKPRTSARTSLDSGGWVSSGTDSGVPRTHLVKVIGVRAEVRVSGARDEKIAAIAQWQRGRVSRSQLKEAGLSSGVIARAVRRGILFPLPGDVFAVGHAAAVELGNETAALLACPEGAALSHCSAARLWDMSTADDGMIHVVVPGGVKTRARGFRVHRTRNLEPQDVRVRKGLPVTSPARTLVDQAEELTLRQLELAFDRALVARIMRPADVAELLARTTGRKGARPLAALLERENGITTLTRSKAEELFLDLVRRAHLPPPQTNVRVAGYEVDFFWPEQRVVVEVDGFRFHSGRRAFEHDHRKVQDLQSAGLTVLRVTYLQLQDEPLVLIARIARALGGCQVATISVPSSGEMATSTE
jgi:very-short-patch-repair endonuclease